MLTVKDLLKAIRGAGSTTKADSSVTPVLLAHASPDKAPSHPAVSRCPLWLTDAALSPRLFTVYPHLTRR